LAGAAAFDGLKVLLICLDNRGSNRTIAPGTDVPMYSAAELLQKENAPVPLLVNGVSVERFDIVGIDACAPGAAQNRLGVLAELKSQLQGSYDLVLVDTPAILIADDVGLFSRLADEILHVVRWGKTTDDQLYDSLGRLETFGLEVSATVINDVNFRRHQRLGYGGQAQYLGHVRPATV
jgi:Mrp family chromosome partitioning ATPase